MKRADFDSKPTYIIIQALDDVLFTLSINNNDESGTVSGVSPEGYEVGAEWFVGDEETLYKITANGTHGWKIIDERVEGGKTLVMFAGKKIADSPPQIYGR